MDVAQARVVASSLRSLQPSPLGTPGVAWAQGLSEARITSAEHALMHYAALFRSGTRGRFTDERSAPVAPIVRTHASESHEGTVLKFTQLVAGRGPGETLETESVLIPMIGKRRVRSYTLCLSSQVGCAMGCTFCQTAQMGLVRSLSPEEIVGQWWAARWMVERPDPSAEIRNVVFMGMGEPLDNLQSVLRAVEVLTDRRGPGLAMSRITISTVGRVDALSRLAAQVAQTGWHRLGLAVSLNAPSDEIRSKIMPVNRAYPLATLRRAVESWPIFGGAHICVEYVLIPGVNDAPEHADMVASFLKGRAYEGPTGAGFPTYPGPALEALVNLIPYNPREGSPWPAPEESSVDAFMARLRERNVYVKRRRTKGRDQMAACGQLGNLAYRRRPVALMRDGQELPGTAPGTASGTA